MQLLSFLLGAFTCITIWWVWRILFSRQEVKRFDEERQRLEQERQIVLEFMHNMAESVAAGSERELLFHEVGRAAIIGTGAISACIYGLTKKNTYRGMAVEGLFPPLKEVPTISGVKLGSRVKFIESLLEAEEFAMGEGLVGWVGREGKTVMIRDAAADQRVVKHEDSSLVISSIILSPIQFREERMGVLVVVNPADGSLFTKTEFTLIESLAEQTALALHNANLLSMQMEKNKLDMDLALAKNIQNLLLPDSYPNHEDLDIDATYATAQIVGGDLYNFFDLDEHRIGVAIADVSGKGVPASLVMAMCQTSLRHYARSEKSPADVLKAVNRELLLGTRKDMFVTFVYAVIDTSKHEMTIARAGHELPIVFRVQGGEREVLRPKSEGMALGMVPSDIFDVVIQETVVPFERGDVLTLFTDGVTEAVNQDEEEFSEARLVDTISGFVSLPAKDINKGVISRVDLFAGENGKRDDFTLLTVKHL